MKRPVALRVAAWVALLGVLAPFVVLAFYAHPQCDDVYFAAEAHSRGVLDAQVFWYRDWSSRYASNLLLSLFGMMPGFFTAYAVLPLGMMLLLVGCAWRLVAVLARGRMTPGDSLLAATAFVTVYIATLYSTREAIYWAASAYTYQSAAALMMLMLADLLRQGNRWQRGALAAFWGFLAAGMNEVTVPVLLLATLAGAGWALWRRRAEAPPWVMAFAAVALGAAIVLASPGNAIRNEYNPDKYTAALTLQYAAEQWIESIPRWLADIAMVGASALCVLLVGREQRRRPFARPRALWLALGTAALFTIPFALFTLVPWSLGWDAPWRVVEHVHYLFLAFWFPLLGGWTVWFMYRPAPAWAEHAARIRSAMPALACVVLVAGLWVGEGTRWALFDLYKGRAARYDRQMRERYAFLKAAREAGQRRVVVEKLVDPPVSLMYFDLAPMAEDVYSYSWGTMFGLETVSIPPEPRPED